MAKLICALLAAVMLFSFCACSAEKEEKQISDGATDDEANYPTPKAENFTECESPTGMRYTFTLDRYTSEFNKLYTDMGGSLEDFPYKNWKKTGSDEENDLKFDYYYLDSGSIVLTATVEQESLCLLNVGCGITETKFSKSKDSEQKMMSVCGIMAAVAGGYGGESAPFFSNLFIDTIDREDHTFWYNSCIYTYSEDNAKNGEKTMLFRTMPAAPKIEAEWSLMDYKQYWLG